MAWLRLLVSIFKSVWLSFKRAAISEAVNYEEASAIPCKSILLSTSTAQALAVKSIKAK